ERPVICFAYDYDTYAVRRGVNIDFRTEMPGGIQTTEDEVIERILTMNVEEECQKTREMLKNKFTYIGGHATEICVEKVFKIKNTTHS
ncbi:MAG: CDP-glycerol glycerophosphotransferase family protein, partial [Prevotella sp.]|nr:CDP-glycerol glycerophosphotransferase family protein [Prevotella sp.]